MSDITLETLGSMTRDQLLDLARVRFALQFSARDNKSAIIDAIAKAAGIGAPTSPQAEKKEDGHIQIRIHRSDKEDEPEDVFVGANGRRFLIKRGEWVTVPKIVANILRDAIQTVYDRKPSKDFPGRIELHPREAESYPFESRPVPGEAAFSA